MLKLKTILFFFSFPKPFYSIFVVTFLLLSAGSFWNEGMLWAQGPPGKGPPPAPVKVAEVREEKIRASLTLVGTVKPRTRSIIASEISGLVKKFPIEEGNLVKKNQVLAELKTDTLRLKLQSAEASLRETLARHEQAERQLARTESLYKEGLATLKQLQDDMADETAVMEKSSQLKTEILQIKTDIGRSKITAPFPGAVVKVFSEVGMWMQQGGAVAEILDLDHVRIQVPIPERHISSLKTGDPVWIELDALPGFKVQGKILYIVSQADENSRTFPVWVDLANPEHRIKSGMMARATLSIGSPTSSKVVPIDALVLQGDRYQVFVVDQGKVKPVPVQVGTMTDNLAEIRGALEVGQQVVTRGNERLRPGQTIRIIQ